MESGTKHEVIVTGHKADTYHILDSAEPKRTRMRAADLTRVWARGQAVLVTRANRAPHTPH